MNNKCKNLFNIAKMEAIILAKESNLQYFGGLKNGDSYIVITAETAYYITDDRYIEKAEKSLTDFTVISANSKIESIRGIIKNLLNIGIEQSLPVGEYLELVAKRDTNGCEFYKKIFRSSKKIFSIIDNDISQCRNVKSDEELQYIKEAVVIAEKALYLTMTEIRTGMTEKELCRILENHMFDLGAESTSFETIIAFGENSSVPHHQTSSRPLCENEPILIDFGAKINGYCSDITRTIAYGSLDSEFENVYNIVREANELAFKTIKCGVLCKDVDKLIRDFIDSTKYKGLFIHALGHGIGLDIHESPRLSRNFSGIFQDGNVVTDEPGIYLKGRFGVRIEDDIAIINGVGVRLTTITQDLIKIDIKN